MLRMKARIIPELDAQHRIVLAPPLVAEVDGDEKLDLVCGACGAVLIQRGDPYLGIHNLVIKCPKCGQCNDTD